eukprot:479386_1
MASAVPKNKGQYLSVGYDIDDDDNDEEDTSNQHIIGKSANMLPMDEFHGDVVKRFLNHILYCAQQQEGFDCYQMISFRRFHSKSRKIKYRRPLKYIGINNKIPFLSEFHGKLFDSFIVACLQLFGITLTMYGFIEDYFVLSNDSNQIASCESSWKDFSESKGFKTLAFLWCVVIARGIYRFLRGSRHDGFYELLSSVSPEDWSKVAFVDVLTLQIGQLINLYVLTVSMCGSFLLVYTTEGGMDSIDMVLNAVALFFMIELDDFMVGSKDYEVVEDFMEKYIKLYDKENGIHNVSLPELPLPKPNVKSVSDEEYKTKTKTIESKICGTQCLRRFNKILKIVAALIFLGNVMTAYIMPFVVMICW